MSKEERMAKYEERKAAIRAKTEERKQDKQDIISTAETPRADIARARSLMSQKIGGGREIKKLPEHLWDGETVHLLAVGKYAGGFGLVTLSDRRLFFLIDGIGKHVSEDFALDKISSISWSSGMTTGRIQVFVSGTKTEITDVPKADGKAIVDNVRGRISGGCAPAADTAAVPAGEDPVLQIQKFAALRDQGILSEEEFSAKKAQILGI